MLGFKQEVNLFLDLYMWTTEHILVKWVLDSECTVWWPKFYGNRYILYNDFLINFTKTKEFIELLEPTDISESIGKILSEDGKKYKLESFEHYSKIGTKDYVAIDGQWIELKVYKSICKMLEEFNNISVKVWEMITFYEVDQPLIIVAPYKVNAQTNLFDKE